MSLSFNLILKERCVKNKLSVWKGSDSQSINAAAFNWLILWAIRHCESCLSLKIINHLGLNPPAQWKSVQLEVETLSLYAGSYHKMLRLWVGRIFGSGQPWKKSEEASDKTMLLHDSLVTFHNMLPVQCLSSRDDGVLDDTNRCWQALPLLIKSLSGHMVRKLSYDWWKGRFELSFSISSLWSCSAFTKPSSQRLLDLRFKNFLCLWDANQILQIVRIKWWCYSYAS